MSTIGTTGLVESRAPDPMRHYTVAEYQQMIQAGTLTKYDRVELLEGRITAKMARNPPHDYSIEATRAEVTNRLPTGWFVRVQCAITTGDSQPEPDNAVVRGGPRDYRGHHPGPTEVGQVTEVSESTLSFDRKEKGRIYARAEIPVYWIVNLIDRQIEVYTDPDSGASPPAYRNRIDYRAGDQVPLVLDGQTLATIPVADLLP